jgi:threonine dehydrogenase-like Zn-dependent dehydrogenase
MRAAVLTSVPGKLIVTDVPKPKLEEPEDAIVRITTSTICGSDLHLIHGLYGSVDEQTGLGHEAIGIVEKVGDAVDFLKPGDRVVIISFHEDGRIAPKQTLVPVLEDEGRQAVGLSSLAGSSQGLQGKLATCEMRKLAKI